MIQPGSFDGGSAPADTIGTLSDFEPIVFTTSANNTIDAAIAGALVSVDIGQTATTDANGGYTITGVPTGGPVCNGDYYRL